MSLQYYFEYLISTEKNVCVIYNTSKYIHNRLLFKSYIRNIIKNYFDYQWIYLSPPTIIHLFPDSVELLRGHGSAQSTLCQALHSKLRNLRPATVVFLIAHSCCQNNGLSETPENLFHYILDKRASVAPIILIRIW